MLKVPPSLMTRRSCSFDDLLEKIKKMNIKQFTLEAKLAQIEGMSQVISCLKVLATSK